MRGQSGILYFPLYFPLRAGDWASHCFGLAAACTLVVDRENEDQAVIW